MLRLGTSDLVVSEFENQSYHFYLELTTSVDNEYQYPLATHLKYLLACAKQHLSSVLFLGIQESKYIFCAQSSPEHAGRGYQHDFWASGW